MSRSRFMIGIAALLLAAGTADAAQVRLRVMETTDIHMNLLDYDYDQDKGIDQFGLARAITLVKAARAETRIDRAAKQPLADADPMVMAAIGDEQRATLDYIRDKATETTAPIHSYVAQVADDLSVQVVPLAQIAYVRAAVKGTDDEKCPILSAAAPFKAGGRQGWGYYADIPVGPVAIKNVADLHIYPNTLKAVLNIRAELREWLEMSAGQSRRINPQGPAEPPLINDGFRSYNFDVVDGVACEIDAPEENCEALVRYVTANPTFNPAADGIWRIRPVAGVSLRFLSGAGAMRYLAANPAFRLVRDNGDGSALFGLAR